MILHKSLSILGTTVTVLFSLVLASCGGGGISGGGGFTGPPTLTLPAPSTASMFVEPTAHYGNEYLDMINASVAYEHGYFGQSVTVAVVDSGLNIDHEAFSGRLEPGKRHDGTTLQNDVNDGVGHGTWVAGVISGASTVQGTVERHFGVAPQAQILPLQVGVQSTVGVTRHLLGPSAIYDAVRYAVTNSVQIINYSLANNIRFDFSVSYENENYLWRMAPDVHELYSTATRNHSLNVAVQYWSDRFSDLLECRGVANCESDLVFVAAAGNDGWNSLSGQVELQTLSISGGSTSTITTAVAVSSFVDNAFISVMFTRINSSTAFTVTINQSASVLFENGGNGPSGRDQLAPLYSRNAQSKMLVVAAVDSATVITRYSNGCGSSKHWCLVAPANATLLPLKDGMTTYGPGPSGRGNLTTAFARTYHGTSFSAPLVSGALAVLKSRLQSMPMSVLRLLILKTATDIPVDPDGEPDGVDDVYGHGLLNIGKAITTQGAVVLELPNVNAISVGTIVITTLPAPNAVNVGYNPVPNLPRHIDTDTASTNAYRRGYFGQNVTVAVINTGMVTNHVAFGNRVLSGKRVLGNGLLDYSFRASLRGNTGIAGLIAGAVTNANGATIRQMGIAPRANILPMQIGDEQGIPSHVVHTDLRIALSYATSRAQVINFAEAYYSNQTEVQYNNTVYLWDAPNTNEILTALDKGLGSNFDIKEIVGGLGNLLEPADLVFVTNTGNNSWNNVSGKVRLVNAADSTMSVELSVATFLSSATINSINRFSRFSNLTRAISISIHQAASIFFKNGGNGVTGLDQLAPLYDQRLQSKFLVVGAVGDNRQITDYSNGCGASKNWCLVAPGNIGANILPSDRGTSAYEANGSLDTRNAAAIVSGALAVLKSRHPSIPMSVLRMLLLRTATDLGASGVDDVYGHGLINVNNAIVASGRVNLYIPVIPEIATSNSALLTESTIALSPALRSFGQGVSGISIATKLFDNFYYDTALVSVTGINLIHDYGISLGFAANDLLSTSKQEIGGLGLRTNSKGNLIDFGFRRKQGLLNYSLCAKCKNSVWDEYKLDHQALPFFADTKRKLQGGWSFGDSIDTFVVLGLDEDNEKDKYAQYGINWKGVELGEWELAGSFSRIQEQQGYLLGSKFEGAFGIGESSSTQLGLRAQRYIEGWRLFGGIDYGKTQTDTINNSLIRRIQGLSYAGWRLGLDKDSIFRSKDKLHFGLTKVPSVISGSMDLELSQTTGDTAFDEDLQMDYLNKTEFRKHKIDLDDSDAFVYRLGYSTAIDKNKRLALGFEHYTDKVNQDNTAFSAQYRFEF